MLPRVIHTIETAEPGGAEKILVQVADGLREEYDPVAVVLQEGWASSEFAKLNIPVTHMPLDRSFDLSWVRRMISFIRENNIKLIHSHEFTTNAYALVAARLAGIPVICTIHGKNYYPDRLYRRIASRMTARYASEFVAVSEDLKNYLVANIGIPGEQITVVHNGIDTCDIDRSRFDRHEIRQQLQIAQDAYVVIVVAALFEMKGHKDLITALLEPVIDSEKLCVLFVGDGDYRAALERQVSECNLVDKVRFLGFRSDIPALLAVSDLFILPSYSEGLPVSVLEAMSAELPVIATDVGGLKEIIRDGDNAYLVPAANPQHLANKIGYCMDNRAVAAQVASQGRRDVTRRFSMDAMLGAYRGLYQRHSAG
jgi:glycosyltransferase involved in cell wall biosynthesis